MHNDEASPVGEQPATMADLAEFERKIGRRLEAQKLLVLNVAKELTRYKAEVTERFDLHEAAAVRMRSGIVGKVDAFMNKSMKIDADQTILIGRMNRLEVMIEKRGGL